MFPDFPLYQIVGKKDWNAPIEATVLRSDKKFSHIIHNAMHFNILFHRDLKKKLLEFL